MDISFFTGAWHCGHSLSGLSAIFCCTSKTLAHFSHSYSYTGISFPPITLQNFAGYFPTLNSNQKGRTDVPFSGSGLVELMAKIIRRAHSVNMFHGLRREKISHPGSPVVCLLLPVFSGIHMALAEIQSKIFWIQGSRFEIMRPWFIFR